MSTRQAQRRTHSGSRPDAVVSPWAIGLCSWRTGKSGFRTDQQRQRRATSPPTWFAPVPKQRPPLDFIGYRLPGFDKAPRGGTLVAKQERAQGGHDAQTSSLAGGWFCRAVRFAGLVGGAERRRTDRPGHVGRRRR